MPRKVNQLRLDRWAAEQATEAARVWIQPALDLLAKAKAERWPLPKLKEEVAKLELDSGTLANSMVSAMQIGMGLGISKVIDKEIAVHTMAENQRKKKK